MSTLLNCQISQISALFHCRLVKLFLMLVFLTGGPLVRAEWDRPHGDFLNGYSELNDIPNGRRIDNYIFSSQPFHDNWINLFKNYRAITVMNLRSEFDDNGTLGQVSPQDQVSQIWQSLGDSHPKAALHYFWNMSWVGSPQQTLPDYSNIGVNDFHPLGVCKGPPDNTHLPTLCDHTRVLKILRIFADANNCPIIVHCHAGMGRTGSVMAALLFAYYGSDMHSAILFANSHGGGVNVEQAAYLNALERDLPHNIGGQLQKSLGLKTLTAGCGH